MPQEEESAVQQAAVFLEASGLRPDVKKKKVNQSTEMWGGAAKAEEHA